METTLDLFELTSEGFNYDQTHALIGKLLLASSEQATAASLASSPMSMGAPLRYASGSPNIGFISTIAADVGESMTIDVKKLGAVGAATSILTGVFTFNNTKLPGVLYSLNSLIDPAKMPLLAGDVLQVTRVLVGGSTMANNRVTVEPQPTITIPNGT